MISMAAGVSVAFPSLWLAAYVWNTRAAAGPLTRTRRSSWPINPLAVCNPPVENNLDDLELGPEFVDSSTLVL